MPYIDLFPAPDVKPAPLSQETALLPGAKRWSYAATGRACLYQILSSGSISGRIAVPAYVCRSVLAPIKKLGLEPVFFDISPDDLNPSVASLAELLSRQRVSSVLFPSLYGLPADCAAAEYLCREVGVTMIDDAAQSFGAMLAGRPVGTFGDAGFVSFSPGKATAAHCGGLYWTKWPHQAPSTGATFIHRLLWLLFSRSRIDERAPRAAGLRTVLKAGYGVLKRRSGWNDRISGFEADLIGGVLFGLRSGSYAFREQWFSAAATAAPSWRGLRLVSAVRGQAHPHKLVIVAETAAVAEQLRALLHSAGIRHGAGYPLLSQDCVPQAVKLVDRVVELPVIADGDRMTTMLGLLAKFDPTPGAR